MVKYFKRENYFSELSENSCYIAGIIAADGYINERRNALRLEFGAKDCFVLEYVKQQIQCDQPIVQSKTRASKYLEICSAAQYVKDLFQFYNIGAAKSLTLLPPNITNSNYINAYILGYYFGDGCLHFDTKNKQYLISFCVSLPFGKWLQQYFLDNFNTAWTLRKTSNSNIHVLRARNKNAIYSFMEQMNSVNVPSAYKPQRKLLKTRSNP